LGVHPKSEIRNPFFIRCFLGGSPNLRTHFSLEVFWEFTQTPKSEILFFIIGFVGSSPKIGKPFFIRGFVGNSPKLRNRKSFFFSVEVFWEGSSPKPRNSFLLDVFSRVHPKSEIRLSLEVFLGSSPEIRNPRFLGNISPELRNLNST